ncbi:MAG TPA: energy-coupling factor transporter transmembrane component T [Marmoricola sp.]|nr:energy-coupling factor transporter transmembrane component T [Marmoricola sp.]
MTAVRRYGPLSLLAASLLPVIGATAIHSARHGAICVAVLVVIAVVVVRDWRSTLFRLAVGLVAAASVALSTWLYGGRDLDLALGAALRVLYIFLPGAVLTGYIDPSALGDHLAQRLHLPARAVVAATAGLERLETLGAQWQQIGRARRARGVGADGGLLRRARVSASMAFALLVSTMRMSGAMALAMDARGFAAAHNRTWAEPAPWQPRDTWILLAGVALAVLPWVLLLPAAEPVLGVR